MGIKQFYADSKEKIEKVYKKVTIEKVFLLVLKMTYLCTFSQFV